MRTVTLAATQFACSVGRARQYRQGEGAGAREREAGANVVLIQELFETPYFCQDQLVDHFQARRAGRGQSADRGDVGVGEGARRRAAVSFFERAGRAHFNSLAMVDADGRMLGVYRKSHIPDGRAIRRSITSRPATPVSRSGRTRYGAMGAGHLLGPMVPGERARDGADGCGDPVLSDRDRQRAAARAASRQPRPTGAARCRATPPPTWFRSSPPTASASRRAGGRDDVLRLILHRRSDRRHRRGARPDGRRAS